MGFVSGESTGREERQAAGEEETTCGRLRGSGVVKGHQGERKSPEELPSSGDVGRSGGKRGGPRARKARWWEPANERKNA